MCFVQIKSVIVPPVVYYLSGTISLIPVEGAFMYLQILLLSFFFKCPGLTHLVHCKCKHFVQKNTLRSAPTLKHNIVNRITRQVSVELPSESYKCLIWKNPAV